MASLINFIFKNRLEPVLRRNCQFFSSSATACGKNSPTIRSAHSLSESVLVASFADGRLECTFHIFKSLLFSTLSVNWAANIRFISQTPKKSCFNPNQHYSGPIFWDHYINH